MNEQDLQKLERLLKTIEDPEGEFFTAIENLEARTDKTEADIQSLAERFSITEEEISLLFQALKNGDLKGDKGDRGEKGDTGERGADGKDGKDGKDGRDGADGIDGKDGRDGVDGSLKELSPEEIRNALELLLGDERLDKSSIKGIEELEAEVKKALAEGKNVKVVGGASPLFLHVDGVKKSQTRYMNFVAGDNVTLSHANPNSTNDITINAIQTKDGTITRSGNYISTVALTGGRTLTVTRSGNYISSISDGTRTWTFTRNGSNQITSWAVTP